jgi:hypothetical protein
MKVHGIYRRLFANDDGVLIELWSNERLAFNRMCQLSIEHKAYHWYHCPIKVNTTADIKVENCHVVQQAQP